MLEYLDNVNSAVDARYVPEDEMSAYPQLMSITKQPGLNYARLGPLHRAKAGQTVLMPSGVPHAVNA
jgi:hypothetical protein